MFLYYMASLYKENYIKKFDEIISSRKLNKSKIIQNVKYLLHNIKKNKSDFENDVAFKYLNKSKASDLNRVNKLKWNNLINTKGDIFKKTLKNSIFTNDLQMALRMIDRNSMSASIENRSPFLDHKFIEYVLSIKTEDFFKNGLSKGMLRNAVKDLNTEKIINQKIKSGRPGSDQYFINKIVKKDFISEVYESKLGDYGFDIGKIVKSLNNISNLKKKSQINKSTNESNFFFRLYSYIVWSKYI